MILQKIRVKENEYLHNATEKYKKAPMLSQVAIGEL